MYWRKAEGLPRGICEVDEKGYLLSVTDRVGVERISGNPMYPNELHKMGWLWMTTAWFQ